MADPVYINVIRDPLARAVSHYYYSVFGSYSNPLKQKTDLNQTIYKERTMEECTRETKCSTFFNVLLPFFCGHKRACQKGLRAEDRWWALQRAKQVIRDKYMVVGMTEDIPAFMELLEALMPSFFANATQIFNRIGSDMQAKYRTVKKAKLHPQLEQKLKERLSADYDLYGFVRQRFYNQLKIVREQKVRTNNVLGKVIDMLNTHGPE